jgi:hypothetical protein
LDDRTSVSQPALCGFRRCQEQLPPPGPRGGRPYEFCPDRTWPGGKSCKQLAAAEQALREALGEEAVPTAALQEAGDAFGRAADAVTEPLKTLSNALDAITARLQDEVNAAAARAEAAEQATREADRQRDVALAQAADAEQVARDAHDGARAAEQAQILAEATADEALAARSAAQLEQARAEASTAAITEQAEKAAVDATAQRARADELTANLATRTEELAVRTAERDAARAALEDLRTQSGTLERVLTAQNTQLGTEVETVQAQLRQSEELNQRLIAEHHARAAEMQTQIGENRADLARAHGQLETARTEITHLTGLHNQNGELLAQVRHRVVEAAVEPPTVSLRDDLLAILLGDAPATPDTGGDDDGA